MQFNSGGSWTWNFFVLILSLIFYLNWFSIFLLFFLDTFKVDRICMIPAAATAWTCTILAGAIATAGCSNAINTILFCPSSVHETVTSRLILLSPLYFLHQTLSKFWIGGLNFGDYWSYSFYSEISSRGLIHRPKLGASGLPGEFLPLGEEVTLRSRQGTDHLSSRAMLLHDYVTPSQQFIFLLILLY